MAILKIKDINGNWVDIPSLIGPQGPVGPKGEAGPQGPAGAVKMAFFKSKSELPEIGSADTLYFVKVDSPTETNYYQEYAWVNKGTEEEPNWDYEDLGGAVLNIDLSEYYNKDEVDNLVLKERKWLDNKYVFYVPVSASQTAVDLKNYLNDNVLPIVQEKGWENIALSILFPDSYAQYSGDYIFESSSDTEILFRKYDSLYYNIYNNVSHTNINKVKMWLKITMSDGVISSATTTFKSLDYHAQYLGTQVNYEKPYMPLYDGSPATKKYVDSNVLPVRYFQDYPDNISRSSTFGTLAVKLNGLKKGIYVNKEANKESASTKHASAYFNWNGMYTSGNSNVKFSGSFVVLTDIDENTEMNIPILFATSSYGDVLMISRKNETEINYFFYGYNFAKLDQWETITGKYTFSKHLPESSLVPTTETQLVNKSYVDGLVGDIETLLGGI